MFQIEYAKGKSGSNTTLKYYSFIQVNIRKNDKATPTLNKDKCKSIHIDIVTLQVSNWMQPKAFHPSSKDKTKKHVKWMVKEKLLLS